MGRVIKRLMCLIRPFVDQNLHAGLGKPEHFPCGYHGCVSTKLNGMGHVLNLFLGKQKVQSSQTDSY